MFVKSSATLLMVCGLFTLAASNSVSADQQDCPIVCPALYAPLCATNGKLFKEFDNTCELRASNCRLERSALSKYVATVMDWCSTELVSDLDQLLVKLDNLDLQMPECMKPCAMIYSPVCVSNGKYRTLVSNQCVMDNFNCALAKKGKEAFRVLQQGSC
ncbi:enhancer of split M1 protein [Calliphora vicina]|uniref:enhancer of split M1 protein n=1 Tax=Calliphora vicina TaxID=7373 RepID=UPI00325AE955